MNIKEILQEVIDDIWQIGEYTYQAEKLEKVLDYIINLQEKYERMKKNAKILSNGYDDLEKRNEKAIEFCKKYDFILKWQLLEILEGDDKE